jgi:arylsulfatase A-like enzyme
LFLLVHYFDPHYEYLRHPQYGFAAERSGRLDGTQGIMKLRSLADPTPDEIAFLRDLYDEEVRHTDAGVGRLLDALRKLGLYDEALIILTADHGEEFHERGWIGHSRSLYDELVRVPLVVRPPGGAPGAPVIDSAVSLVSLAPTVLDYAGVDPGPFDFQGPSWRSLLSGSGASPGAVLVEVDFVPLRPRHFTSVHKKAVVVGRHKLIRDDRSGRLELYDLRADPGETRDLSPERPELVERLLPLLEAQLGAASAGSARSEAVEFSEEEIRQLEALGYVDP